MVGKLKRMILHLSANPMKMRRTFSPELIERVAQLIAESEKRHSGELRLCIEYALPLGSLLGGVEAHERALQLFAQHRVWDTEHNNGVLIYVLVAERNFEIVADRGLNGKVPATEWRSICEEMEESFRQGGFEAGLRNGVSKITGLLTRHFPRTSDDVNELPDRPILV